MAKHRITASPYIISPCARRFEPATVSWDSFLLNHSPQYGIAIAAGILEFVLESVLFPYAKTGPVGDGMATLGLLLACGGQALRMTAMWTAGSNFTHLVQEHRRDGHDLVERGVYRWLRHPSYCGWFWWSIGTQLVLRNPVCSVAYAVAAHSFFRDRIAFEEATLRDFFGDAYVAYAKRTIIGIPMIN